MTLTNTTSQVQTDADTKLDALLNKQRDLYKPQTTHDRRLLRIIKQLAEHVAQSKGVSFNQAFWCDFHEYIKCNQSEVAAYASSMISEYLDVNANNVSAGHTIKSYYMNAFCLWGIIVPDSTQQRIKELQKFVWSPTAVSRRGRSKQAKASQYNAVQPVWSKVIKWLRTVSLHNLRDHLRNIVANQGVYPGVSAQSFHEMTKLCNKDDESLEDILRCTVAFASLLSTTGMRGITALDLRLNNFVAQADGSILVTRTEHKLGNHRNATKEVYVRLAQGKLLEDCTLVHLAEYFAGAENGVPEFPFYLGFGSRSVIEPANMVRRRESAKMPQRRFTAMLEAAAIANDLNGLCGDKKVHLLRFMCNNQVMSLGATSVESQEYIGWDKDVHAKSYTLSKQRALESKVPYLLAGRSSSEEPGHPMWDLLKEIPDGDSMDYWQRVLYLVSACGITTRSPVDVAPEFTKRVQAHIKLELAQRDQSLSLVQLKRRLRDVQDQLQKERTKCARLEIQLGRNDCVPSGGAKMISDAVDANNSPNVAQEDKPERRLIALVQDISSHKSELDFPKYCLDCFPKVARLVNLSATPVCTFGLPQSSTTGKNLMRILLLACLYRLSPHVQRGTQRSWFDWIGRFEKDQNHSLHQVSTKSW